MCWAFFLGYGLALARSDVQWQLHDGQASVLIFYKSASSNMQYLIDCHAIEYRKLPLTKSATDLLVLLFDRVQGLMHQ